MIKKALIFTGVLLAFVIMALIGFRSYTKSFSPQEEISLEEEGLKIYLQYSRPYKRERIIFGRLVPYNEVWRTGANEATTFSTNSTLVIKGKVLPAGEYTLWTIPGEERWQIIWNKETGQWGVDLDQKANRDPALDQLIVEAPVIPSSKVFEQFTIDIKKVADDIHMVLMWEQTMVVVPMTTIKKPGEG
jgi:hypothetical protein